MRFISETWRYFQNNYLNPAWSHSPKEHPGPLLHQQTQPRETQHWFSASQTTRLSTLSLPRDHSSTRRCPGKSTSMSKPNGTTSSRTCGTSWNNSQLTSQTTTSTWTGLSSNNISDHTWTAICKMYRKKQRSYNLTKRTHKAKHWERFITLKRDTRNALRSAHWN